MKIENIITDTIEMTNDSNEEWKINTLTNDTIIITNNVVYRIVDNRLKSKGVNNPTKINIKNNKIDEIKACKMNIMGTYTKMETMNNPAIIPTKQSPI